MNRSFSEIKAPNTLHIILIFMDFQKSSIQINR